MACRATPLLLLLPLAGCGGPEPADDPTGPIDADGDGVFPPEDCDDRDKTRFPDADELCDGIDNDCDGKIDDDDDDVTDGPLWFADTDEDGFGDGLKSTVLCAPPAGFVADSTDCDDSNPDVHPRALEVCNGIDDDCDFRTDWPASWWDADWTMRLPVTLTAPAVALAGAPVAIPLDFGDLVESAGAEGEFAPDSIRVVQADCSVILPSQFADGLRTMFDKGPASDPLGDAVGTLVFIWDDDGDLTTPSTPVPAGGVIEVMVYFGTDADDLAAAPAPSPLTIEASGMASGAATFTLDPDAGGLLDTVSLDDGPELGGQATPCCGNGVYSADSGWGVAAQNGPGTTTVIARGPVFGAIEVRGTRADALSHVDYTYTYSMFASLPEVWVRTEMTAASDTTVEHHDDFVEHVRPWQSSHPAFGMDAIHTVADDLTWADVSDDTAGLMFAWVEPPLHITRTVAFAGEILAYGNDWVGTGAPTQVIPAGTRFQDGSVAALIPHDGDPDDSLESLASHMESMTWELGKLETLP